ncbi:MAG: rhodanese-like domain-containing protein [Alphaproteobacteria bacterium]
MLDLDPLLLIPLALVLILMAMPVLSRKRHGKVDSIDAVALKAELHSDTKPYIFDLRPAKEFKEGHIPGAASFDASDLVDQAGDISSAVHRTKSEPVVLVCQSDLVSTGVYKKLKRLGWENIRILKGGMFKWKRSFMPIESGNEY